LIICISDVNQWTPVKQIGSQPRAEINLLQFNPDTTYVLRVIALNDYGMSPYSEPSQEFRTPATVSPSMYCYKNAFKIKNLIYYFLTWLLNLFLHIFKRFQPEIHRIIVPWHTHYVLLLLFFSHISFMTIFCHLIHSVYRSDRFFITNLFSFKM
jgi:hypothetical protein